MLSQSIWLSIRSCVAIEQVMVSRCVSDSRPEVSRSTVCYSSSASDFHSHVAIDFEIIRRHFWLLMLLLDIKFHTASECYNPP